MLEEERRYTETPITVQVYALILASLAFAWQSQKAWLIRHNITILLSELGIYAYRNLWPLATYTKEPADIGEGWLMWAKLGTLAFAAIIIPLSIPNVYTPVDPKVKRIYARTCVSLRLIHDDSALRKYHTLSKRLRSSPSGPSTISPPSSTLLGRSPISLPLICHPWQITIGPRIS